MTITVKKLIAELQQIENQYLEVEVFNGHNKGYPCHEIDRVSKSTNGKKLYIFTKAQDF